MDNSSFILPKHLGTNCLDGLQPKKEDRLAEEIKNIVGIRNTVMHYDSMHQTTTENIKEYYESLLAFSKGIVCILTEKIESSKK